MKDSGQSERSKCDDLAAFEIDSESICSFIHSSMHSFAAGEDLSLTPKVGPALFILSGLNQASINLYFLFFSVDHRQQGGDLHQELMRFSSILP